MDSITVAIPGLIYRGRVKKISTNSTRFASQEANAAEKNIQQSPSDLTIPLTKEGFTKAYAKWGEAGFKRINAMLKPALRKAQSSHDCKEAVIVDFAAERSEQENRPVVFVDCLDARFYFTEEDLNSSAPAVSQKEKAQLIDRHEATQLCESGVKDKLTQPSTFDASMMNYNVRAGRTGNVIVTFDFEAQNALGVKAPYTAECIFSENGVMAKPRILDRK